MRRLPKPNFQYTGSFWVDGAILPESLRLKLRDDCRRGKLTNEETDSMLACASLEAQFAIETGHLRASAAIRQRELLTLANRAHSLQQALRALDPATVVTFGCHWAELAFLPDPPVSLELAGEDAKVLHEEEEGSFLGAAWDRVADLELSARYAAGQCNPNRQAQFARQVAHGLVRMLADRHRQLTGRLPPYSKETWFPTFMATLCGWPRLRLGCGRAIVETAVRSLVNPDDAHAGGHR